MRALFDSMPGKVTLWFCLVNVCFWVGAGLAVAHHPALSSIISHVTSEKVDVLLELDALALSEELRLDLDGNNVVDAEELKKAEVQVMTYVGQKFQLQSNLGPCLAQPLERFAPTTEARRLQVFRAYRCPEGASRVVFHNTMLFEMSGGHRHVAQIQAGDGRILQHIFERGRDRYAVEIPGGSVGEDVETTNDSQEESWFLGFLWEGIYHILIGLDHILFLLLLLLAARKGKEVLWIVTSFTLAHSITLGLGALGIVNPSVAMVESAIALSILYVAIENTMIEEPRARYVLTFFFGLVHGFGFSNVLGDLGLEGEGLVQGLLGFNLGVELGQLAIVLPVFPLVKLLRDKKKTMHRRLVMVGSIGVGVLALLWFVERAFGVSMLPF